MIASHRNDEDGWSFEDLMKIKGDKGVSLESIEKRQPKLSYEER